MNNFVFANNVLTTLASATSNTATTLTLTSSLNLPALGTGQVMPLTLNDVSTGQIYEIVYVTAISGVTLTVTRGQEGTTPQNWSIGDHAFCSPTADSVAPVNGSTAQPFQVAPATTSAQAVPLGQANSLYVNSGAAADGLNTVILTGSTQLTSAAHSGKLLDIWSMAANSVITIPQSGNVVPTGFNCVIGPVNASGVTILVPPTSIIDMFLPDGSAVTPGSSYTLPEGAGRGFHLYEFANSLRLETIGRTIVSNAVNPNEAVALGQANARYGLVGYTVATLPSGLLQGTRAYVTDATAPTFLGALTGGGAVVCPVFYNGTAWIAG